MFVVVQSTLKELLMRQYFCIGRLADVLLRLFFKWRFVSDTAGILHSYSYSLM